MSFKQNVCHSDKGRISAVLEILYFVKKTGFLRLHKG